MKLEEKKIVNINVFKIENWKLYLKYNVKKVKII